MLNPSLELDHEARSGNARQLMQTDGSHGFILGLPGFQSERYNSILL